MREDDWHHVGSIHLQGNVLTYTAILFIALDTLCILHGDTASTLYQQDSKGEHENQDNNLHNEHHQATTCFVQATGELLDDSTRKTCNDTNQDDEGNTVSNTTIGNALTQPHHKHRACAEQDSRGYGEPVEPYFQHLTSLRHLHTKVHQVTGTLEQQDSHRQVTRDLIHLLATRLTFFLHLLEIRYCNSEQLYHDGRRDVRHDTERKDRCIGECTTREHIQKSHQATRSLRMKGCQSRGVDTRQNDERTKTIDEHEQKRGQQSISEVLNLPDILTCFDKFHLLCVFERERDRSQNSYPKPYD